MLFNSYFFILIFLPITTFFYFFLSNRKLVLASKIWLAAASLFFYAWWNVALLPVILVSIAFNYSIGSCIIPHQRISIGLKQAILVIGIVFNLLLLGYFKYFMFFETNINVILQAFFSPLTHFRLLVFDIVLPLGISFFTFTQIAYLVDVYRGVAKEYSLLNYILFVTFFPHLIAGPIIHHKEMMPQFDSLRNKSLNHENFRKGLFLFSIGLFKKLVLADTFAFWANYGFNQGVVLTTIEAWLVSFSYTFQLYFDFSGYTDMALGTALFFNIKLPTNFNSPYKAQNIRDFWKRWHMTLSRFFMEYVYIPMGGNKRGDLKTYINLIVTFFIGGIWHGAGWLFLIWGGLHGFASVIYRIWLRFNFRLHPLISWIIMFNFLNFTWIFFRAKNLMVVNNIIGSMVGIFQGSVGSVKSFDVLIFRHHVCINWSHEESIIGIKTVLLVALGFIITLGFINSNEIATKVNHDLKWAVFTGLLFGVSILFLVRNSPFLYFQF